MKDVNVDETCKPNFKPILETENYLCVVNPHFVDLQKILNLYNDSPLK